MDVTEVGSPSRSICLHGCESARLISSASLSTSPSGCSKAKGLRRRRPEAPWAAAWQQRFPCALPHRVGHEESRGKCEQSAEDNQRAEPASVGHHTQNKTAGRRDHPGLPEGVRSSSRDLLLGTQPAPPDEAQQKDKAGCHREGRSPASSLPAN